MSGPDEQLGVARGAEPRAEEDAARCIVVYDAQCEFCRAQIERIRRSDRKGQFEFVSNRDAGLIDRHPQLAGHDLDDGLRVIVPTGEVFEGASAVHQVARRLRGFRMIAWVYRIIGMPRVLGTLYRWIARHRHQLPGGRRAAGRDAQ